MIIGSIGVIYIGGDAIFAHHLLISVTTGAPGGDLQAENGGVYLSSLRVTVAIGATWGIRIARKIGHPVH
jgi:hypothetical protein